MKISVKDFVLFLIAFFTILSHSIYAYQNNRIIVNMIYAILSILPVVYCYMYGVRIPKKMKGRIGKILFGYYLIIFVYGLLRVPGADLISYVCRYAVFLPFMILVFISMYTNSKDINILFKYISNIVLVIAIISLFFWFFGTQLHIVPSTGQVWAVWGNSYRRIYYGVYLEVPGNISGTSLNRNSGIFCEAPAFAYFLSLGFGFEVLVNDNSKQWKKIVFIISLVSTGTTTGLLIILFVIATKLWDKTSRKRIKEILMRFGIVTVFVIAAILVYKFASSESKMASVMLRQNDYINGFTTWLNNPILGVGYMADLASTYYTGFSNSITQILVSGGLLHTTIYLTGFFGALFTAWTNKSTKYTYWIIMCGLLFSISIVGYAYITLFILASQYSYYISNRLQKKEKVCL